MHGYATCCASGRALANVHTHGSRNVRPLDRHEPNERMKVRPDARPQRAISRLTPRRRVVAFSVRSCSREKPHATAAASSASLAATLRAGERSRSLGRSDERGEPFSRARRLAGHSLAARTPRRPGAFPRPALSFSLSPARFPLSTRSYIGAYPRETERDRESTWAMSVPGYVALCHVTRPRLIACDPPSLFPSLYVVRDYLYAGGNYGSRMQSERNRGIASSIEHDASYARCTH